MENFNFNAVFDIFLSSFVSAYYVNLTDMSYVILRREKELNTKYGALSNFFYSLKKYINEDVHEEDRALLLESLNPVDIKDLLKTKTEFSYIFRDIRNSNDRYYRVQIIKGLDENHAAIGFIDIDQEYREKLIYDEQLANEKKKVVDMERHSKLHSKIRSQNNMINSGIWSVEIDRVTDSTEVYCSHDFTMILGYENHDDFVSTMDNILSLIHPEDLQRAENLLLKLRNGGYEIYEQEYRLYNAKEKQYKWYKVSGRLDESRINDDKYVFYGTLTDETLLRENEQQSAVISVLSDDYEYVSCIDIDTKEEYVYRSNPDYNAIVPRWSEISDFYTRIDLLLDYFVVEEDKSLFYSATRIENILNELRDKKIYSIDYRIKNGENIEFWQLKFALNKDNNNQLIAGFSNVDDIVRERKLYQENLEHALEVANSASKAKTSFLSNMSHDIRTPMNAIMGFTDMAMKDFDKPEKVKYYLDKVNAASEHLMRLINDVLDMSRIEAGKISLNENPENIKEILLEIKDIIIADAASKNQEVFFDTRNIFNSDIVCDRLRLNQILLNIISNSVKYTPAGGFISLKITETPNDITGYSNFEFEIRDNGIGMSKDYIEHIFEPFSRANNTTYSGVHGTGLGMTITKNMIDLMSGTINIESDENKGTRTVVSLPFKIMRCD